MAKEIHFTDDGKLYIGKSMVESYLFCPRQFELQYLKGQQGEANQVMVMGTRFHEFAFKFFDYCEVVEPDHWEVFIPEEFSQIENDMAAWFIRYERNRLYELTKAGKEDLWRPAFRELRMVDDELILESTVDRGDWISKDEQIVRLVEYKTGSAVNERSLVRQLAFYAILWMVGGFGTVKELQLINPKMQISPVYPMSDDLLKSTMKDIIKLRRALDTNNFTPKCTEGKFAACQRCTLVEAQLDVTDEFLEKCADLVADDEKFANIVESLLIEEGIL